MFKYRLPIILTLGALIAIIAYFVISGDETPAEETPVQATLTISESVVQEVQWPDIIKATGPVSAWQEAIIGAEISGQRLVSVKADVGDMVEKGQVLAKYNTATLSAEYAELKANWVAADSNQQRAISLRDSGALSDQVIEDYINRAAVAKAQMDAKAMQLNYATILAPDNGVISARTATLGAVGNSGDELFRLIRQNRLEWRGELTAAQVLRVAQNQSVTLILPNGEQAEASIRQIAPSFNPDTRMTTVYADVQSGSKAMAGMYAEGRIGLSEQTTLSIPAKSVVIRDGRNYVFVVVATISQTTVERREVQVGQTRDTEAQILNGITKVERVAVDGAGFLNDGDVVKVVDGKGNAS